MATFSEIDLTFLAAFDPTAATNKLNVLFSINGVINSIQNFIVVTRSGAGQFSEGTDATTQAQFYKAALDLDIVPSASWEVVIVGAVVTIKSTNPLVLFESILVGAPNDARVTTVTRNISTPIADTAGLFLARSNFYLSQTITTEQFVEVQMYFRTGDNRLNPAIGNS